MDPVTLGIVFLGAGIGHMFVRYAVERFSKETGSIAISTPREVDDYDARWSDPEYVAMIHATRLKEKEELGVIYTECECQACKNIANPVGCGFNGCGASGCEKRCQSAKPKPVSNVFDQQSAYKGPWPAHVPRHATVKTWYDAEMLCGKVSFQWYNMGGMKCNFTLKLADELWDTYEIHVDQYEKPVATFSELKGTKEGTHIVFTKSGPKKVTEDQLRDVISDLREREKHIKMLEQHIEENQVKIEKALNKHMLGKPGPRIRHEAPRIKTVKGYK
jgi:hypothetical protein